MSAKKLPWEKGFVPPVPDQNLIGAVTGAVTAAENAATQAAQIGSEVVTDAATVGTTVATDAANVATGAVQAAEGVAGAVVATPPPAPSAAPSTPVGGVESALVQDLQSVALNAAKQTTISLLPGIEQAVQKRVAGVVQTELSDLLAKVEGGTQPAVPNLSDFTKADARSRAIRTLILGVVLSGLWGIVNVLGNLGTVNWSDKNALPQVISIAVTGVVGAIVAYVARILKEPAHIANATIIPAPATTS